MPMREYRDAADVLWHVYEVRPLTPISRRPTLENIGSTSGPSSESQVSGSGDERGWLCFESGDNKRRLIPIQPGWEQLGEADLERLCARAEPARPRRPL